MKIKKTLKAITVIELIILFILGAIGVKIESSIGNLVGILLILIAPCTLLILISRDKSVPNRKRNLAFGAFLFLLLAFVLASIVEFLT